MPKTRSAYYISEIEASPRMRVVFSEENDKGIALIEVKAYLTV